MWAADVYGAIHPLARRMVSTLARALVKQRPLADVDSVSPGQLVWRALSGAVVLRAANHHLRHAVALSAVSVAEPVEDTLGNSYALPGVNDMSDNTEEAEGDIAAEQADGKAADEAGGSRGHITGVGPSEGHQDLQGTLSGRAVAADLGGPPPPAVYAHELYGPAPGAAEMVL